jgi:MoxR-like ATPase
MAAMTTPLAATYSPEHARPRDVLDALRATVVGQEDVLEALVLALIAGGHVLLEGAPGVAKTLACRALAAAVAGTFRRVQFTPDLLPSDIVGTRVFDQKTGEFATVLGPLFANVVLADEINRAPAKVQSALLEGMQERRVTIGPQTHDLPAPFVVLATMNPFDAEGTYALPLAQLDRFLAKVVVRYPSRDEERTIVDRFGAGEPPLRANVAALEDVLRWQREAHGVHVDAQVRDYAIDLVRATRGAELVAHGASPRAALALVQLTRARAYADDRTFATPDDVRDLAPAVLRHRISYDDRIAIAGGDPEDVIRRIVASVPAP